MSILLEPAVKPVDDYKLHFPEFDLISSVADQDGVPTAYPWKLIFPSGSVIDNGDGTASIFSSGVPIGSPGADKQILFNKAGIASGDPRFYVEYSDPNHLEVHALGGLLHTLDEFNNGEVWLTGGTYAIDVRGYAGGNAAVNLSRNLGTGYIKLLDNTGSNAQMDMYVENGGGYGAIFHGTARPTVSILGGGGAQDGLLVFDGNLSIGNGLLRIYEAGAVPTYASSFVGGVMSADIAYTLPTALGAAGSVLKDVAGNGVLSWGTGSVAETDPLSLHIDQTTPQTVINGTPIFQYGITLGIGTGGASPSLNFDGALGDGTLSWVDGIGGTGHFLFSTDVMFSTRWSNQIGVYLVGATPSVISSNKFVTNNAGAVTITNLTDGTTNEIIWIEAGDANTTIKNNSNIQLIGGTDHKMTLGESLSFTYNGSKWLEIGRGNMINPMTTLGDMIYSSDNLGTPARVVPTPSFSPEGRSIHKYLGVVGDGLGAGGQPEWFMSTPPGIMSYYFKDAASDISTYKQMVSLSNFTPAALASVTKNSVSDGDTLITWATNSNYPNKVKISTFGYFTVQTGERTLTGTGTARVYAEIYTRTTGGTETKIATTEYSELIASGTGSGPLQAQLFTTLTINATDRFVVKVKVKVYTGSPNITIKYDGVGTDETHASLMITSGSFDDTDYVLNSGNVKDVNIGTHSFTANTITDGTASLTGGSLTGVKLGSLTSNGFVKTSGGDGTLSIDTSVYMPLVATPAAPTSTGTKNSCSFDDDWFYVCVQTDTWRRTALATWVPTPYLLLETGDRFLLETGDKIILEN